MSSTTPKARLISKSSGSLLFIVLVVLAISCVVERGHAFAESRSQSRNSGRSGLVEGKDYVVLERVRILDEMGFDRPVEAFGILQAACMVP